MNRVSELRPKATLLKHGKNYAEFIIENITPAIANSIRRAVLSEVPTLAIDEVVFLENSTAMFDEVIAHRLALIPLYIDKETYKVLKECYWEGKREECTLLFTLEVEALGEPRVIYSSDLKYEGPLSSILPENIKVDIRPVSDKIPIIKLERGQKLILEAYAKMGIGKDHAKWQPVSSSTYKYKPVIKLLNPVCNKDCKKCISVCPKGVFGIEDGKLKIIDPLSCTLCRACEEACPDYIKVRWDERTIIFKVETHGTLPLIEILSTAVESLERKLDELTEKLKNLVRAKV